MDLILHTADRALFAKFFSWWWHWTLVSSSFNQFSGTTHSAFLAVCRVANLAVF